MLTDKEFHAAAERYLDMVYRLALNTLRHPADAEDAAQEVMLRLWKNTSGFEGDAHLRHWLGRVTINVCKDLSRAPWRLHSVPLAQAPPQPCADEPEAQAVVEEILRLPKKDRVPLYLYHYEGYSVREISALLRANPSTIRTRLSRARELLKHQLEEG